MFTGFVLLIRIAQDSLNNNIVVFIVEHKNFISYDLLQHGDAWVQQSNTTICAKTLFTHAALDGLLKTFI